MIPLSEKRLKLLPRIGLCFGLFRSAQEPFSQRTCRILNWQRPVGTLNWAGGCRLDVDAAGVEAAAMSCGREGRWCTALALKSTALQGSEAEKIREGSDYAGRWFETA